MHRSKSSRSPASGVFLYTAIAGAVLGAIAAVPARSLLSPAIAAVPVCAHCGAADGPSAHYYFPSRFAAPQRPVEEPIATF